MLLLILRPGGPEGVREGREPPPTLMISGREAGGENLKFQAGRAGKIITVTTTTTAGRPGGRV